MVLSWPFASWGHAAITVWALLLLAGLVVLWVMERGQGR